MRLITRLYPKSFRVRFGDQIALTFCDLMDDAAAHGRSTLLITVASLYDASVGIVQEWTMEFVIMIFKTRSLTVLALLLFAPFVLLLGAFLSGAQGLSTLTIDGQQLTNIGRLIVFGSVLLLPVSMIANIAGILSARKAGESLAFILSSSSVLLFTVQTIAIVAIGLWMITEAISCSAGICD